MQFGDRGLDHAFDPLKVVDIKTLAAVSEDLKKSKDKSKRAIGVFLDRINRLRTADMTNDSPVGRGSVSQAPSTRESATTQSQLLDSSGLRDLRD